MKHLQMLQSKATLQVYTAGSSPQLVEENFGRFRFSREDAIFFKVKGIVDQRLVAVVGFVVTHPETCNKINNSRQLNWPLGRLQLVRLAAGPLQIQMCTVD